jgi:aspartyl-tRNA(Asn)/glutamyl-tRNA(Gln) amidotransferase subunit A
MSDHATLPAADLLRLYRSKQLSPVEVVEAALARIERFDGDVNAFCLVDGEGALQAARESEARWQAGKPAGLLDGVPATIKDLVLTKGWPTRRGSKTIDPAGPWEEDAPVVARLREAGAVLLGKTTTPEFGWMGVTDNPLTGITRNPWNTGRTPGGSSGGAAVAAALGMGALHIGTDGGGSIRIPAGFTGIFGHKPSFGRVPAYPPSPFATVAHVGPMTRTVEDAALMLTVLSKPDARDWFALPYEARDYRIGLHEGIEGLRIAYSPALGYADVDPEIAELVKAAVPVFEELGAVVEAVDPGFEDPLHVFAAIWFSGAAKLLANLDQQQRATMDPGLVEIADAGAKYTLAQYLDANAARVALGQTMRRFHERNDLLLTPSQPLPAGTGRTGRCRGPCPGYRRTRRAPRPRPGEQR